MTNKITQNQIVPATASQIVNDSAVAGASTKDALNTLNNQIGVSASSAVTFYLDDTTIVPTGTQNVNQVNTLTKNPVTTAEVVDNITVNNNTVFGECYLYPTALGGSQIDSGTWSFDIWRSVDNTAAVTQLLINTMLVKVQTATITITGSGTLRTATASSGTVFLAADANANIATASYLQTPTGLFQITAFTSATVVTVAVPTTYVNESVVSFKLHRRLFQVTTGDINDTTLTAQSIISVQSAFPISAGDQLSTIFFGTTTRTSNTIISFTHNGSSRYSHFETPLVTRHNDLAGLQGGTTNQYYHITSNQSSAITGANSPSGSNVFATMNDIPGGELTPNELAAIQGANSPSASNVFGTVNDIPVTRALVSGNQSIQPKTNTDMYYTTGDVVGSYGWFNGGLFGSDGTYHSGTTGECQVNNSSGTQMARLTANAGANNKLVRPTDMQGGVLDTTVNPVMTPIKFVDNSNQSLNTTNKTYAGGINEIYANIGTKTDETITITSDGQTSGFAALAHTPKIILFAVLNNAIYRNAVDFSVSGTSFTWLNSSVTLNIGDNLYISYQY